MSKAPEPFSNKPIVISDEEQAYPDYLTAENHTHECIRCKRVYKHIQQGFHRKGHVKGKPSEYRTVCMVCKHEEQVLPALHKRIDSRVHQKLFREEVKKAAQAHVRAQQAKKELQQQQVDRETLAKKEIAKRELGYGE